MRTRASIGIVTAVMSTAAVQGLWGQGLDLTGEVAAETRLFPLAPQFARQGGERASPSFSLAPKLVYEWAGGRWRFTAAPFLRVDAHDSRRTHGDVRELGLLYLGDRITVFAGAGKVFWGVTEVHHLIDIVNQTDAVEDLDGEDKLGQPMVSITLEGAWGYLDLFWLPYFRERTYPDAAARLRGPLPVFSEAGYTAGAGRWHQDVALRWSRPFGAFDVGASFFRGTSREPRFVPTLNGDGVLGLRPQYDVIDQTALDVQWTGDAALLKLEAMTRGGHGRRFLAVTGGIEYTLYRVFPGDANLGLVAEFMVDGRSEAAPPTVFDHDLFLGMRWALNDVAGTSILGGPVIDYETGEVLAMVEAERRMGNGWKMAVEARWFANTRAGSLTDGLRRDSYVSVKLTRFL